MNDYPPQDPLETKRQYEQALQHQGQTFAQQIEEARARLNLPKDATAWQIMCANADAETQNKHFLRSLLGL